MARHYVLSIIIFIVVLLPGCGGRVLDWARASVNQGCSLPDCYSTAGRYVRSVFLYDQFTTSAIFDAMWISCEVLRTYANMWALKNNKSDLELEQFADHIFSEHESYITFYVLSLYDVPLNNDESLWSFFLEVEGRIYQPVELALVELDTLYQRLFGRYFTLFKVPYAIKFRNADAEGNDIITKKTHTISLVARSVEKEGKMTWCFDHRD